MKANPWWYTDEGNDEENNFFSSLYYAWAKQFYWTTYRVPEPTKSLRPFIVEQLAGEMLEREHDRTHILILISSFWLLIVALVWVPVLIWIFWGRD